MIRKELNLIWATCLVLLLIVCPFYEASADERHDHELLGRKPVCLKDYPTDPALFNDIVRPYVHKIIERHGMEEWKAVLLTNELHRHLGMWSIVGAKMGIRAREVLRAPFDELEVISFSGFKPPFSCLSDGLQVSTGASLGRANITNTHLGQPEAMFIYKGKRLNMKVKPEIKAEIRRVIKELSGKYGFRSAKYFHELDKESVKYWFEWDRNKMFVEDLE
jgi:pyrimidine-specific ribonucleoside hydrolase